MRASVIATALFAVGLTGAAQAQQKPADFPQRPLTVVVPYGAGGGSDQLARAWVAAMEPIVGQPFQVVNKPGGGGLAAVPDFMTAPADGYTILQSIDDAVTNFASGRLKSNPATDWEPICMTQITFSQIYVRGDDTRFPDWKAFLDYAQANPGKASVANVGNLGSMERINMVQLEEELNFKSNQVAFDNPSERYAALIGGQVDAMFEQPGDVKAFLDSKQMRPILTFLTERPSAFGDVPTVREAGARFEPLLRFRGFWARPDAPADRRAYLEAACKQAFDSPEFQKFNEANFMTLIDSYRDTLGSRQLIESSANTYVAIYRKLGLVK